MRTSEQIKAEIEERFGFFPPFFGPAQQNPQVLENLWQQTLSAYINNPLPALFKEKLCTYLSRYCSVPYCLVCHSCSLRSLGMTAQQILALLELPIPEAEDIEEHLRQLVAQPDLVAMPLNPALEQSLLSCAILTFLEREGVEHVRTQWRSLLGVENYQHAIALVSYLKMCFIWVEAHPEVDYETDKRVREDLAGLLKDSALADFLQNYRQRVEQEWHQAVLPTKAKYQQLSRELLARERAARAEAEAANRFKDEFLAILSHELRSPLHPILGWAKLLQNCKFDAAKTAYGLEIIERNAKLQSQLIEDLLDVSCIFQGKLSLQICPVDPISIIEAAVETVRPAARAKSIQLSTIFERHVGQVLGDPNRLQQVAWNLLSNAINFTATGGRVEVRLSVVSRQSSITNEERNNGQRTTNSYTQIQISDTGCGISPDLLPHVFDYFRQGDSTTTRKFGGLGLGLAVVRHIVELHGGAVRAASPGVGLGATFTILLPTKSVVPQSEQIAKLVPVTTAIAPVGDRVYPPTVTALATVPHIELVPCCFPEKNDRQKASDALLHLPSNLHPAKPCILLVEDNADVSDYLKLLLQARYEVETLTDGAAALASARHRVPDLVLSDVMMPGLDGFELLRELRADPQTREVPIILLSARADLDSTIEGLEAGADDYLSKPFSSRELFARVAANLELAQMRREVHYERAARVEAEQAQRELEKLNRLKDDFLSTVSHELRTPMTNIKMAIQMLQVATLPEQRHRYMQILQVECTREIDLINNLLDLQRLESGAASVERSQFQLQDWLVPIVEPFIERTRSRQQTLQLDLSPKLPQLLSDPASLERIVVELLNNACKYTPEGGEITIAARPLLSSEPNYGVELIFSNSGCEIPEPELERIFEKFYRIQSSDPWKQGGTGLGLALVQKLVELLGGKIRAESQADQVTFTVELPGNNS